MNSHNKDQRADTGISQYAHIYTTAHAKWISQTRTRGGTAGGGPRRLRLCIAALINDRHWTEEKDEASLTRPVVGMYGCPQLNIVTNYCKLSVLYISHLNKWRVLQCFHKLDTKIFYSHFCQSSRRTPPRGLPAGPPGHLRTTLYSAWKQRNISKFKNHK